MVIDRSPMERSRLRRLKVAIIGLGHRGFKRGLREFQSNETYDVLALCDPDDNALRQASSCSSTAVTFHSVDELLEEHRNAGTPFKLDCAYLAVPHACYSEIVPALISNGIHVLKEKPAGMTTADVEYFQSLANEHEVCLVTAAQKRFGEQWRLIQQWLPLVGELQSIEGTRKINVSDLQNGWRARRTIAGGGVVKDLGWHLIDLVLGVAGSGYMPKLRHARLLRTRKAEHYDCEDSAHLAIDLEPVHSTTDDSRVVPCSLRISRIGHEAAEEVTITGHTGLLVVRSSSIIFSAHATPSDQLRYADFSSSQDFRQMLRCFAFQLRVGKPSDEYRAWSSRDRTISSLIDEIYSREDARTSLRVARNAVPQAMQISGKIDTRMSWPKITPDVIQSIVNQAVESISIYGNEGVFHVFESEFASAMGQPRAHALLHNSGTNALQSLFYAANFLPQDEVIFPVYTFHATCSPAMVFGIVPIFCDVDAHGNLDPAALERLITAKTKAVVVTHMWGMPCQMSRILDVLWPRPTVLLFEDCSHAHGAKIGGQVVGTFGDGAVWSLQGQKIVSGGEGGISLTRHRDFHVKQLIWGHYNKRCKTEISADHDLRPFSLTGAGMKNRAHPLAVAIALNQLRKLVAFKNVKASFAHAIATALEPIKFLSASDPRRLSRHRVEPAWYAFPFYFDQAKAPPGLDREKFVALLLAEGLSEIDIPRSTRPLHKEPLFTSPATVLPHVYSSSYVDPNADREYPGAFKVYNGIIKMPVWAYKEDGPVVQHYIRSIQAVASRWLDVESKL